MESSVLNLHSYKTGHILRLVNGSDTEIPDLSLILCEVVSFVSSLLQNGSDTEFCVSVSVSVHEIHVLTQTLESPVLALQVSSLHSYKTDQTHVLTQTH